MDSANVPQENTMTSVETNSAVNVGEQDAAGAGQLRVIGGDQDAAGAAHLRVGGDQDAAGASQLGVVGGDEDAAGPAQLGVVGRSTQPQYKGMSFKTGSSNDKGKMVLKDTLKKEKQMIKVVEMKSINELQGLKSDNEVEGLKSHIHGTLHSRMSPSSIVQVMESVLLSQNQLKAVRDIGFGSMEFLKVTQLSLRLGLWLVQHFDAKTCSLNILDSDPFRITEDHVHEVLGLPIGGIEINKNNFSRNKKVIRQWKKQFQSNSLSIKIGELKEFLKEHKSAGAMFKRNFVVLCVSTLMDGKQNMNINSDILTFLSDVDKIKDLNWSKYILDSLVKGKLLWEERPTRSFPGSLLFLMEVRAAREIPILKGWTTAMLSTREKLELFKGRLGNIRAKKLDVGSSSMTQPKMLIILTKLREKYTLGIIASEVNTIQSVKEIA
uniref:Uncharacterized protein n=1 Tax=Chenopodium quinoa TaxID=63459 RepID=A0A803MR79_CHEQI